MEKEPCGRYKTGWLGNPHLDFLAGVAYTPSMAGVRLDSDQNLNSDAFPRGDAPSHHFASLRAVSTCTLHPAGAVGQMRPRRSGSEATEKVVGFKKQVN